MDGESAGIEGFAEVGGNCYEGVDGVFGGEGWGLQEADVVDHERPGEINVVVEVRVVVIIVLPYIHRLAPIRRNQACYFDW